MFTEIFYDITYRIFNNEQIKSKWHILLIAKDSGTELEDSGSNLVERSHFDDLVTEYIDVYEDMKHTKDDLLKLQDLVSRILSDFKENHLMRSYAWFFKLFLIICPTTVKP